jgi:hypothetical protein
VLAGPRHQVSERQRPGQHRTSAEHQQKNTEHGKKHEPDCTRQLPGAKGAERAPAAGSIRH